jgi:CHRD domain
MLSKTKKLGVSAIIAVVGLVMISMTGLNNNNNLIAIHQSAFAYTCTGTGIHEHCLIDTFTAKLAGDNQVPPVTTSATGTVQFQLRDITMANIYQGKPGENGQPVASLSMGKGTIYDRDLKGPLAGKDEFALASIMRNGSAYVNVHTQQNPNGEVRGQIMPDKNTNHQ